MEDKPFEDLIEQSAAGLKVDPEIYLEAKRELRSHLNEKQERFEREGHTPEESTELARKWFGSPMDVAAELLSANRQRMRLRSLIRLAFDAVFIPIVVVAALYVGYGRAARGATMVAQVGVVGGMRMPTLPFFRVSPLPDIVRLLGTSASPEQMRRYYDAHRAAPDSYLYYAFYCANLDSGRLNGAEYVKTVRFGESLEPQNALYNLLLAHYYLEHGMIASTERDARRGEPKTDEVLDRSAFNQGMAEWWKAVKKPYLSTHKQEITRKALDSMTRPVYWEDYSVYGMATRVDLFRLNARERSLARKLPGCVRILSSEGHKREAEALMDTWRVLPTLLAEESQAGLDAMVALATAQMMSKQAGSVYKTLGAKDKVRQTDAAYNRLEVVHDKRLRPRVTGPSANMVERHGSILAGIMEPVFSSADVTPEELTPGRMADYAFFENGATSAFLAILTMFLIGTVVQGFVWLRRLRRSAAVPLLLLPPTQVLARAIGLGVALPIALYGLYTQLPVISGREYGLAFGAMNGRLETEMCVVALLVLWLPALIVRKYVRRRCRALAIEMPTPRDEAKSGWSLRSSLVATCAIAAGCAAVPGIIEREDSAVILVPLAIASAILIATIASVRAGRKRREYGLYYGTLARSMATVYAFTILLIAVVVQPILLHSERNWARKDAFTFGYLADKSVPPAALGLLEARYTQKLSDAIKEALKD